MPNHVTNVIESSNAVIASMLDDKGFVDFCAIIPRHKDLEMNGADGISSAAESAAKLMCKEKPSDNELLARMEMVNMLRSSALEMDDDSFDQFVMMMRNKRKHGFYHMMDYARNAWGTKWNAYSQSLDSNSETSVRFDTAWSHPLPVIEALSKKFPDEEIRIKFADEDTGSNCGTYTIKGGDITQEDIAPNWGDQSSEEKRKWAQFAFTLRYPNDDPKEYGYNDDWEYVEE